MTKFEKILGGILGAAIGDAMGAPLKTRPPYLIKDELGKGNYIYDYISMPDDSPQKNFPKGIVTDAFAISYISMLEFIKDGGITKQTAINALLEFKNNKIYEKYYASVDPTTKIGIMKLEGINIEKTPYDYLPCDNRTLTNEAAMKSWVCGIFNPGNIEKAIYDSNLMCKLTHDNVIALSGASSIAAATSIAMIEGSTLSEIVEAGIYGARQGYRKAMYFAKKAAGASVEERIKLAVEIGIKYSNDFEKCITEMTEIVGTGTNASEAVPSSFGFLVASNGDVMKSIHLAINAGNDSNITGIMVGAIAGSLKGVTSIPETHLSFLSDVNSMDIEGVARKIRKIIW